MNTFRTQKSVKKYLNYLKTGVKPGFCPLCDKAPAIKKFNYWKISENSYPYDKIAKVHHMAIPMRHVSEEDLNAKEVAELRKIRESYMHEEYDWIIEAANRRKSIPDHFHLHLIVAK